MKKLFICLCTLLISVSVFAETKFCGISFDITQSEAEKGKLEDNLEKKLEPMFLKYCKDIDVDFYYFKSDKKLNYIQIDFEYNSGYAVPMYIISYLTDALNCKMFEDYFYNEELLFYVSNNGSQIILQIYNRQPFNALLDSAFN